METRSSPGPTSTGTSAWTRRSQGASSSGQRKDRDFTGSALARPSPQAATPRTSRGRWGGLRDIGNIHFKKKFIHTFLTFPVNFFINLIHELSNNEDKYH